MASSGLRNREIPQAPLAERFTASRISLFRNPTKIIARPLSPLQGTQKIFGTMPCPSVLCADPMVLNQPFGGSRGQRDAL
jgi:hypothetical protein